jgi:hypothetical protein
VDVGKRKRLLCRLQLGRIAIHAAATVKHDRRYRAYLDPALRLYQISDGAPGMQRSPMTAQIAE